MSVSVRRLALADIALLRDLNRLFGRAFEDPDTYGGAPPDDGYLAHLLVKEHVFVQADPGDEAALALYTKLGVREDVHRFGIPVSPGD